ncbi:MULTISPECIES: hypothetical protein [Microcoleaceae]|uniref:hypothetical protein n=1 Tax=Microcoleaceae TaxID=1892252 RepID=UPI0018819E36|nr:hypothetical protein [Tychonema sp. LEGE 06208]MBE9161328.1 hypothetical protein [Tychonema sp. LEGE 06208]
MPFPCLAERLAGSARWVERFCVVGVKKTFWSRTRRKEVYDLKYNKVFNPNCGDTGRSPASV